jgi:hypothetical protein
LHNRVIVDLQAGMATQPITRSWAYPRVSHDILPTLSDPTSRDSNKPSGCVSMEVGWYYPHSLADIEELANPQYERLPEILSS